MALTTAEKKEFSKKLYMAGYSSARAAALLNISDTLIADYWDEWADAAIRQGDAMDFPIIVTDRGPEVAAEHGAGAIGTVFAPRTYRWIENGGIITEIEIDLTGLDSSGVENDVIGLNTGGAAYIGRNVVTENGIVHRVEMTCLEVPTGGDADIILVQGSAADEAFDDTVADTAAICDGTGDWTLGETIVYNAGLTADYYLYLTQGATDDATYTAGQFLIRMFGHPALLA